MDQEDDAIATGIDTCLTKDGQNSPTANLPMATNRHTGVGNAVARTDYSSAADIIDQNLSYYVDTGAANVYVITPSPAITAYAEGQKFIFRAVNAGTGAATLNVNALGAIAIETNDGVALVSGMIASGGYYEVTYDANGTRFVLTSADSLTGVRTTRNVIAGTGLTGGGMLSADVTLNAIAGTGITVAADSISTDDSAIVHDNLSGVTADEHVAHSGVSITAGTGLTGGGTIAATRTLNVAAGTGISVAANSVSTNDGQIVHDNLSGVTANEHIDHSGVSVTAGVGLTGGGTIASTRTINVGAGSGISVSADNVALDISGLTEQTGLQGSLDYIPMYDDSGAVNLKISIDDLNAAATAGVPTTRNLVAGAGMTGGGDLSADRTFNVIAGSGITVNADDVALASSTAGAGMTYASGVLNAIASTGITVNANSIQTNDAQIVHDSLSGFVANEHINHTSITFTAGVGLSGGGTLAGNRTFTVDLNELATEVSIASGDFLPMVDITDSGSGKITFANLESTISHANIAGVTANEHIDHSGVSVTAGSGLTGGGTIAATRTLNVGAGSGITVNANDIALASTSAGTGLAYSTGVINLDISGLTSITASGLASTDGFLVDNGGVPNRMSYTDNGISVQTVTGTTDTLATADMNAFIEYTNAGAVAVTLNSGVGSVGNVLIIKQTGAGQVTVSGTATLESAIGNSTRKADSVITLVCIASGVWSLYGDQA